jgi:hypothetical protein
VNGHPFSPMHAPCSAHLICPELMRKIFQYMKFQSIIFNCTSDPPTSKIYLAGIFESRELRSNHYGRHFLTKFPKIYLFKSYLETHTLYSHNTYIYIHIDLHIQVGEVSCSCYWQQEILDIFMHIGMKLMLVGGTIWEM